MGFGSIVKKAFTPIRLKKRKFDPKKVDIEGIKLPKIIEDFEVRTIISFVKEEIATYRSLGYRHHELTNLKKLE